VNGREGPWIIEELQLISLAQTVPISYYSIKTITCENTYSNQKSPVRIIDIEHLLENKY
jgi:hypothetical protein